jgi:hypothetical protein
VSWAVRKRKPAEDARAVGFRELEDFRELPAVKLESEMGGAG